MDLSRVIQQTILTLRTVKFVKISQLAYRIWFKVRRVSLPDTSPAAERRAILEWTQPIPKTTSVTSEGHYTFLNSTLDFSAGINWSNAPASRLWLYNLHYFDFINAVHDENKVSSTVEVMRDWVSNNPPVQGTGWEPYPASLRIVNWVKWFVREEKYSAAKREGVPTHIPKHIIPSDLLDSLVVQIRWLSKTIEYHILANHLFTNGKAMVCAGLYFNGPEADRWLAQGLGIVNAELKEQILEDGGHFERSPMYHHIILEDLLDLLNLARATPESVDDKVLTSWQATAVKMLGWAKAMSHPNGELAFFNDAAYGIAPKLEMLASYSERLGIINHSPSSSDSRSGGQSQLLASSGFALLRTRDTRLIADIGLVGPDYQPGHAHADTLSFELAYKGETLIVNSGTSTYEMGEQRQYERSTRAHSTVEINELDSSEVWAGFRVARRARPRDVCFDTASKSTTVSACHDGYRRLASPVTHQRQWILDDEKLRITDSLTGDFNTAVARFYLHPSVQVLDGQYLVTNTGSKIRWDVQGGVAIVERSFWYPVFGGSEENVHIAVTLTESQASFTLYFT